MKYDINAIIDRIKEIKKLNSDLDVAEILGISRTALAERKRRSSIPFEEIIRFSDKEGLSHEWLLTGKGPERYVDKATFFGENQIDRPVTARVDVFTLAGAGSPKLLTEYEPIESIWLPLEFTGPNIVPVKIRGQSMYPTIWDGALVGVDTGDKVVISGEIYAIWIPYEGAVVKRLFMEFDRVMVKSDNPQFPTLSIPYKELEAGGHGDNFILGRVKWVIQKQ